MEIDKTTNNLTVVIINKGFVESKLINENEYTIKLKGTLGSLLLTPSIGAISYQGMFEDDSG